MTLKQEQSVDGGKAYQAGGDLTVNQGMSADQVTEIMIAMATQLSAFSIDANRKVDERLVEFRNALLEEISKPTNGANTEAFADPDYQYAVNEAQKSFVRDGSEKLLSELVGLLIQRSKFDPTERVAKIINQALETVGNLSSSEHATLAIAFLFANVKVGGSGHPQFFERFSRYMSPFIKDLTSNVSCYEYLESQRCISINLVMTRDLAATMGTMYGSRLGQGFDWSQLTSAFGAENMNLMGSFIGTTGYADKPFFFDAESAEILSKDLAVKSISPEASAKILELFQSTLASPDAVSTRFDEELAGFSRVVELWKETPLKSMNLTAVGKVIAHSALTARGDFDAPLSIWVS
jgi:hypothetical protein